MVCSLKNFESVCRQRKTWNCQRCGSAAFPNFRGGTSSPRACRGAKAVRTNSRILHTL